MSTPTDTYLCRNCDVRSPTTALTWCCPKCGGPWDLETPEPHPPLPPLPALAPRTNSLWRYTEALPVMPYAPEVTLGEGRTPLVPLTDTVSAKLDFLMPTLSFKDRGAVMLAAHALRLARLGLVDRMVADSSGNAGTAVAAYGARAGLATTVYVPEGTSPKKLEQIRAHGAEVVEVAGDREATASAAREAANAPRTFYASHVYNPYFLQGTKTYVLELWEDLGGRLPDTIVVPVGNGTLLLGAALALTELRAQGLTDSRPTLVAVQAEPVSPLARAFHADTDTLPPTPSRPTLAEGIAITAPPRARQILEAVRATGGTFLTVTDTDIRTAQQDLAHRGLFVEPTAAACWAAIRTTPPHPGLTVLPLCGAGAKTGMAP
ncbi:threonine synthase [Streptomyces sp. NPDC056144]|uniref:threonine synthase n=1 Tax=unclassified Streptomyces TaxID=2593676 RepID=UPI0035D5E3CE